MVARRNRFITQNIYQLKKLFGVPIKLARRSAAVINYTTGVTQHNYEVQCFNAILLPTKETADHEWAREIQQFSRGGYYNVGVRTFIIGVNDLTPDFKIKEDDFLIYNDRRYDIFEINDYEEMRSYLVRAIEVKGGPLFKVECISVGNDIHFEGELDFEL